ncbi:MAG: YggS family pyridoxal phosphate-dependent enzyme [Phycisphaerae bacterium]
MNTISAKKVTSWQERLAANLSAVRGRIDQACRRAGRDAAEVLLLPVTKYVDLDVVAELRRLGLTNLGENRVQQLVRRAELCGRDAAGLLDPPAAAPRWHMIGHLQRNKVRALLAACRIIHSLDSVRLADEISNQAQRLSVTVDVLVEVNVAGEANKTGAQPADATEICRRVTALPGIRLCGVMTMAPIGPDPQASRPMFRGLCEFFQALRRAERLPEWCRELSMGMTQDYEVAVEEGATIVRIGSALFEGIFHDVVAEPA